MSFFFIWWSHPLCRCLAWQLKQKHSRAKSLVHSLFSSSSACWASVCLLARKKKVDISLFTQGCLPNKLRRRTLLPDDETDLWSSHSFVKHYAKFGPVTTGSTGWCSELQKESFFWPSFLCPENMQQKLNLLINKLVETSGGVSVACTNLRSLPCCGLNNKRNFWVPGLNTLYRHGDRYCVFFCVWLCSFRFFPLSYVTCCNSVYCRCC